VPPESPHYLGPVHFMVIPNEHIPSALYVTDDNAVVAGRLFAVAAKLARERGIAETGFRLVTNAGPDAKQEVLHLHLHCLGGRNLGWACAASASLIIRWIPAAIRGVPVAVY
jgi:histidine triad (HIT) family protein